MQSLEYHSPSTAKQNWAWMGKAAPVAGWCSLFAAIVCSALTLWAARLPASYMPTMLLGFLCGMASGLLWLISLAGEIFVERFAERRSFMRIRLLLCTLVLLSALSALLFAGVPRTIMFRAKRPAMNRWVQQLMATPGAPPLEARVGSYDAKDIELIPGGVKFLVEGAGFFRRGGGFAFSPSGPPAVNGPAYETYTPLSGGWYLRTYEEE